MERQDNKVGDHAVYCLLGIVILALLSYLASESPIVIHKLDLPVLSVQSKLFGTCFFDDDLKDEHHRILRIISIVDREVKKRGGYRTINAPALRDTVRKASERTSLTARCITIIFFIVTGSFMIIAAVCARDTLYDRRENIRTSRLAGVEGFVRIVGAYLDRNMVCAVRRSPTPERLCDAFRTARQRVNIPCCVVGRLFPRESAQRLALLEYGKTNVVFAREKDPAAPSGPGVTKKDR